MHAVSSRDSIRLTARRKSVFQRSHQPQQLRDVGYVPAARQSVGDAKVLMMARLNMYIGPTLYTVCMSLLCLLELNLTSVLRWQAIEFNVWRSSRLSTISENINNNN